MKIHEFLFNRQLEEGNFSTCAGCAYLVTEVYPDGQPDHDMPYTCDGQAGTCQAVDGVLRDDEEVPGT